MKEHDDESSPVIFYSDGQNLHCEKCHEIFPTVAAVLDHQVDHADDEDPEA